MGDGLDAIDDDVVVLGEVALSGRRREQDSERRTRRLTPRVSARERAEIEVAAASVGMTVNGFCAEVVLTAVRMLPMSYAAAQERETLARLQRQLFEARTAVNRFGGNVNHAVAKFHATGQPPIAALTHAVELSMRAVRNVDDLVNELHRRLRQ